MSNFGFADDELEAMEPLNWFAIVTESRRLLFRECMLFRLVFSRESRKMARSQSSQLICGWRSRMKMSMASARMNIIGGTWAGRRASFWRHRMQLRDAGNKWRMESRHSPATSNSIDTVSRASSTGSMWINEPAYTTYGVGSQFQSYL